MESNQQEISLLYESPGDLIVKYQPIVEVVVRVFMKSGYFRGEEAQEVIQFVNEKLLERMEKIRMSYNGLAKLRTYFSVVIKNLCLEKVRKGRVQEVTRLIEEQDHNLSYSPDQLNRLIIKQELDRLHIILGMMYSQRARIIVFYKALLRFPVSEAELFAYYPGTFPETCQKSIGKLLRGDFSSDRDVFRNLNQINNHAGGKDNTADAIRKWVYCKEVEMIVLLNGDPPRSSHTHETLKILFERYFQEQREYCPDFKLTFEYSVTNHRRIKSNCRG